MEPDSSAALYSLYEPLAVETPNVRLLHLLKGSKSEPIICRLTHVNLDEDPEYEALSYTWGDPTVTQPIRVNDSLRQFTSNLVLALQYLRYDDRDRYLWVDAVCINQADTVERGQQVTMMGQIYSKAKDVIVWLGEEQSIPPNALRPFNFATSFQEVEKQGINRLKKILLANIPGDLSGRPSLDDSLNQLRLDGKSPTDDRDTNSDPGQVDFDNDKVLLAFTVLFMLSQDTHILALVEDGTPEQNDFRETILDALAEVFRRPWWSRMWVVQEIVLAKDVTVMYGDISAPWEMFASAGLGVERHRNSCCFETRSQKQQFWATLSTISNEILEIEQSQLLRRGDDEVARFFKEYGKEGAEAPKGGLIRQNRTKLGAYIWHTRQRIATDPRDKVYGVLGLVPDWLDTEPIVPDYSTSSYHVFRDATLKLIRGQRNFDIFCEVQGRWSNHPDLQSFIKSHKSPSTAILEKMINYNRTYGPYLPSWVPDLTAPAPYHQADRQAKLLLTTCVSIANMPLEVHDKYVISTLSLSIDVVIDAGPILFIPPGHTSEAKGVLTDTLSSAHVFKDWSSSIISLKCFMPDNYPLGGGTFEQAFMRTVCGGVKWRRHPHGNRRPIFILEFGMGDGFYNELEDSDLAVYKQWEDWVLRNQHLSLPEYCQQRGLEEGALRSLNKAVISNCLGRRFFCTLKGYIGMGPPGMQPGDVIKVPFGSRTPFVVRAGGEAQLSTKGLQRCFTLIGDCYVQGIMRGEIQQAYERVRVAYEAGEKNIDGTEIKRFDLETLYLQ
jgi:hypothetical protein